jgi:hypothetical protein
MALILSVITLAALYYPPQLLISYVKTIPDITTQTLINQLLNPIIPTLGILTATLVFSTIILRKTRIEGPSLILLGLTLLVYSYFIFHGGNINLKIPVIEIQRTLGQNIPINVQAELTVHTTTLMIASMISSLILLIKGTMLTTTRTMKTQCARANSD